MRVSSDRIEQLRYFARIERTAIMEACGREGEDPLTTLSALPSIDEFVVRELRDEMLEDRGQLAEFMLARLAAQGTGSEAVTHAKNADQVEFELLREIAEHNPELTAATWTIAAGLSL